MQEQVPEPAVKQMQSGVLHASVVPVHGHEVIQRLLAGKFLVVMRIAVAKEVPAGTRPLGHGIGFALGRAATLGAGGIDPVGHGCQGALAAVGGLVVFHVGQEYGQVALRHGHGTAVRAVHHGDRLAPVALAAEHPVTQLVVDLALAQALFHQPVDDLLLGVGHAQAVEEIAVAQHAVHDIGVGFLGDIAAGNHLHHGDAKLGGKLPVAGVMRRHGHDGAGAIAHEHIVADPDGDLLAIDRVDGADAVDLNAGLVLGQLRALKVALLGGLVAVGGDGGVVGDLILVLLDERMFGAHNHVGCAKERVGPGGEHAQLLILAGELEVHRLDEIDMVQPVQQFLRVLGDAQHPLALDPPHHLAAAALTHAAHHFFVGQAAFAAGAPVDGHFGLIAQAVFQQFQKNPLGPFIVGGIGGVDLTCVVEAETQALELLAEVVDVLFGDHGRMDLVFDGIVLRGQAKGIITDGVKDVVALHAALAGDDVQRRVGAWMAHMQAISAGVGELDQAIVFGLVAGKLGIEHAAVQPTLLPFLFNLFGVVRGTLRHLSLSFIQNQAFLSISMPLSIRRRLSSLPSR